VDDDAALVAGVDVVDGAVVADVDVETVVLVVVGAVLVVVGAVLVVVGAVLVVVGAVLVVVGAELVVGAATPVVVGDRPVVGVDVGAALPPEVVDGRTAAVVWVGSVTDPEPEPQPAARHAMATTAMGVGTARRRIVEKPLDCWCGAVMVSFDGLSARRRQLFRSERRCPLAESRLLHDSLHCVRYVHRPFIDRPFAPPPLAFGAVAVAHADKAPGRSGRRALRDGSNW
jgi:hypothetical protein